jgi:hypothetical protein
MREVRDSGKVMGADRIAVMVALNLAHELLQEKSDQDIGGQFRQQASARVVPSHRDRPQRHDATGTLTGLTLPYVVGTPCGVRQQARYSLEPML